VRADSATIWTASQGTHGNRGTFARFLGLPREKVRLIYVEGSGCYGMNGHEDAAADAAKLDKRVSMHSLRHAFATHLLEQKTDIRVIQVLLGHNQIETTTLYTQVATELLRQVTSPLENLPPS